MCIQQKLNEAQDKALTNANIKISELRQDLKNERLLSSIRLHNLKRANNKLNRLKEKYHE